MEYNDLNDLASQTNGVIFVFDVTSKRSFNAIVGIRETVFVLLNRDVIPSVLVGTKTDEPVREVTTETAMRMAEVFRWGIRLYSAQCFGLT